MPLFKMEVTALCPPIMQLILLSHQSMLTLEEAPSLCCLSMLASVAKMTLPSLSPPHTCRQGRGTGSEREKGKRGRKIGGRNEFSVVPLNLHHEVTISNDWAIGLLKKSDSSKSKWFKRTQSLHLRCRYFTEFLHTEQDGDRMGISHFWQSQASITPFNSEVRQLSAY